MKNQTTNLLCAVLENLANNQKITTTQVMINDQRHDVDIQKLIEQARGER